MSKSFWNQLSNRLLAYGKSISPLRWLSVGMGVKRWLVVLGIGSAAAGIGLVYLIIWLNNQQLVPDAIYDLITMRGWPNWIRILLPVSVGGGAIVFAIYRLGATLVAPFQDPTVPLAESIYLHRQTEHIRRGPHIVAIGGGSGLPSLLRGLTSYTRNITSIVTMADDGGSSGRLRRELGLLPPGDLRSNMAALARDEALMTQLLQYRFGDNLNFREKSELQGHSFGNLLLAALTGITGSFDDALLAAERVLALRGRVLPSTVNQVVLSADVFFPEENVIRRIVGESSIPETGGEIRRVLLQPADVKAYPPALRAILQADLIVLGPGSLYTSIIPNLLVPDIAQALQHTRARKVYVCNLAAQPGETDGYSVADHVKAVSSYLATGTVDYVVANDNWSVEPGTGDGETVYVPMGKPAGVHLIKTDLVDETRPWRHDSDKLARAVLSLLNQKKMSSTM